MKYVIHFPLEGEFYTGMQPNCGLSRNCIDAHFDLDKAAFFNSEDRAQEVAELILDNLGEQVTKPQFKILSEEQATIEQLPF